MTARSAVIPLRPLLALIHRWVGLGMAAFLFVSGVTGAVISWDHELDEWLNPHLTEARADGPPLSPLMLARQVEARHPDIQVTFVPLAAEPGHSLAFFVEPRVDPATGRLFEPGFNQVFVDPASGAELGTRHWGAVWPINAENFVSFLYVLHFSLHIPEFGGIDHWGEWLMGAIALIWTIDCFTGFCLTLPARRRSTAPDGDAGRSWWQRWKPSWAVRWRGGSYKVNFDLHRAGSLWTWALLFIVAFTAFSLNLYREVFFPVMSLVSDVTPTPFDLRTPAPDTAPVQARFGYGELLDAAQREAGRRGWEEPAGAVFYARNIGVFCVQFFHPEDEHGAGGVGPRTLYLDALDGRLLGQREPWTGSAADIFVQAQFPLHSGRILGLPGRILISVMGLVVAMLCVTGVVIWARKRSARRRSMNAPQVPASPGTAQPGGAIR
jgi:uncharacterized iron-regulated membrane protein